MKIFVLLFFPMILCSQVPIIVQQDTFVRPMPLIGFNTNAHHSMANWKIPKFRDTAASLHPAIYRYPGGTTANHWDWKTGWFQNAPTTPPEFANINPKNTIRAEEFKLGLDAAKAEALFVLNVQHSNSAYEVKGLQHAESVGCAIRYIEFGNEHNLKISYQYMPPEVYAESAAVWADTVKKYFPQSKICLVGGALPATSGWHDSIFARSPKIDALAFHVYLGAGNSDSLFNVTRALSVPFAQLNQRFHQGKFPNIPSYVEVWVTEFNLGEVLAGDPQQFAGTWTHGLYVAAMLHLFLENQKITMMIDHNLTNQSEFAAIDPLNHSVTANGVVMRLFGETSKGMESAARLVFPSVSSQSFGTTVFPKLIGWKFTKGNEERGLIINLSPDTIICSLTGLFESPITLRHTSADPAKKITGPADLTVSVTSNGAQFTAAPYSITQILPRLNTSVRRTEQLPNTFALFQNYPNPFNPSTTITYSLDAPGLTTMTIFDALGRKTLTVVNAFREAGVYSVSLNADAFSSGIYFYRLESNGRIITKKMMVLR